MCVRQKLNHGTVVTAILENSRYTNITDQVNEKTVSNLYNDVNAVIAHIIDFAVYTAGLWIIDEASLVNTVVTENLLKRKQIDFLASYII